MCCRMSVGIVVGLDVLIGVLCPCSTQMSFSLLVGVAPTVF